MTDTRRDPWWLKTPATPARALPLRHGSVVEAMAGLDLREQRVLIAGPSGLVHSARDAALRAGADPDEVLHDPI